jgi:hypothetical protein
MCVCDITKGDSRPASLGLVCHRHRAEMKSTIASPIMKHMKQQSDSPGGVVVLAVCVQSVLAGSAASQA